MVFLIAVVTVVAAMKPPAANRIAETNNSLMLLLSIIIPLGPADDSWPLLFNDLQQHHRLLNVNEHSYEIILAYNEANITIPNTRSVQNIPVQVLKTRNGRAQSMNDASRIAQGEYLWFVHADTRINQQAVQALLQTLKTQPQSLMYFDLIFSERNELRRMSINSVGLKWRSRVLKCPFGDQAFCIKQSLFNRSGHYREDLHYGEDHLFVWQARGQGIKLQALNTTVTTSARKYQKHGWFYTSSLHIFYFIKQALPAFYVYQFKHSKHKL